MGRAGALLPLAVIALFALLDVSGGPDRVVIGLVVIAPLLAASLTGRWLTAGYAALAPVVVAVVGAYDDQYTADAWPTAAAQLFGVALGGMFAIAACNARIEREVRLQEVSAEAVEARARAVGAEQTATLAEALQRNLLADPPRVPHLDVAVRYLPAAEHVRIGGDWYDVFTVPGGRTVLVIGDVAGHDGGAATTMAQVRNVVRGVAHVLVDPPATILSAVDRAVCSLNPGVLATMILAEVTTAVDGTGLVLRWSSAGHPPPVLVRADRSASVLEHDPDLLLGVDPGTARTDHELALGWGDTLVMFTDGLVEQRGTVIDEGLRRVVDVAWAGHVHPLESLCDALVDRLPGRVDDDTAVLAVRARCAE